MHVLLIFLDGIGLGADDPTRNPFAVMHSPTLHALTNGRRWLADTPRLESEQAIFVPTDAVLGVTRTRPASGSGQAALLTGRNIPQEIGDHYGPKPNAAIRDILDSDNLFITLTQAGKSAALINPFPPPFFRAIERGRRLPSSIQYAVLAAGLPILTHEDYYQGQAISPDWTGKGWTQHLGFHDAPTYSPFEAGRRLAQLAQQRDFTMFSTWITDEIGHRGTVAEGVAFMEATDQAIAGILAEWDAADGLIILTADHGNMEEIGDRRHSWNPVPTLAIGGGRHSFAAQLQDLTDITPGILRVLGLGQETPPPR